VRIIAQVLDYHRITSVFSPLFPSFDGYIN
jgi:hypothetical protein